MKKVRTVIKLNSDNFENTYLTFDAYKEIRLSMSTGDFHTHKHEIVEVDEDTEVLELNDVIDTYEEFENENH